MPKKSNAQACIKCDSTTGTCKCHKAKFKIGDLVSVKYLDHPDCTAIVVGKYKTCGYRMYEVLVAKRGGFEHPDSFGSTVEPEQLTLISSAALVSLGLHVLAGKEALAGQVESTTNLLSLPYDGSYWVIGPDGSVTAHT